MEPLIPFGICSKFQKSHLFVGLPEEKESEDLPDKDNANFTGDERAEEIEISEEDQKAFEKFMPEDPSKRATLADIIKDKLTEKQTELQTVFSDTGNLSGAELEKVTDLYKGVGKVLSKYRSGKIPLAFKTLPRFRNWEQLIYLTEPDNWTAATMFQATRIFCNQSSDVAQRFYNLILLPRLRDDIAECKRLNDHLYRALKKALFKTSAFYKGLILPLCESGNCTLREATIFGSIISKCTIPILHSSAALLMISQLPYNGANSIFMRVLIEKKYSLPYPVIDGVVEYFLKFKDDDRQLPLQWHQCLLTFVRIYKNDLCLEQQQELLHLLTVQNHHHVTPEIRKELLQAILRDRKPSKPIDIN
ncbi:bystin [Trichonephila inaurata madagascariensis]|uniref:Bystin n=1 Tax=Trichonephila inaurata madagascariensis TaxID=2747483 RepID=A0A8X7C4R8_9ARAC|nr:bystin [Trichonephila inaurata madagascariensis]